MNSSSPRSDHPSSCGVLHVIPMHGIGGVEVAAREGAMQSGGAIRVHGLTQAPDPLEKDSHWLSEGRPGNPLGFGALLDLLRQVKRLDPPVLLFSLWRSVLAFTAVRVLHPRRRTVLFLHSSHSIHWADRLATGWMTLLADEIWADSPATLKLRLGARANRLRTRPISFVLQRTLTTARSAVGPQFISWCRLKAEKRIDRALDLIAALKQQLDGVTFTIIGPDAGCLGQLERHAKALGLGAEVQFAGPMERDAIEQESRAATFFLQLSTIEGQSMAVVEAMQFGLVPVVTPVGAIPHYCFDGRNALIVDTLERTAERLVQLLAEPECVRQMAGAANRQFASARLYVDDVLEAAEALARTTRRHAPMSRLR